MRRRLTILALVVGMVGALLATSGAYGIHDTDVEDNILRLHLNGPGDSYFSHGDLTQNLTDPGNCEVTEDGSPVSDGSLVSLVGRQGSSSSKPVGLNQDSIGVKSKGPGVSCGRVDDREFLTLSIANGASDDLAGLNFIGGELDIETKKNVTVVAELKLDGSTIDTFQLRTGSSIIPGQGVPTVGPYSRVATSTYDDPSTPVDERIANCGSQSDSGPDSGANDNCRWVIDSLLPFDTIVFSPMNNKTEFGLEAGSDGTVSGPRGAELSTGDSLFFLTRAEGILECGQTKSESDGPYTSGSFTRLDTLSVAGGCEVAKPYLLDVAAGAEPGEAGEITFAPEGATIEALYRGEITLGTKPASNPPTHFTLQYDRDLDGTDFPYTDMVWCNVRPVADSTEVGLFPEIAGDPDTTTDDKFPTLTDLDPTETWCIVAVNTVTLGGGMYTAGDPPAFTAGETLDTWIVFGNDDPVFGGR